MGDGLCISNCPRCDVISVSDTLRRKLIASVHVGDRFHVDHSAGNNYKKLSSSTPNCFHRIALVKSVSVCVSLCIETVCQRKRSCISFYDSIVQH